MKKGISIVAVLCAVICLAAVFAACSGGNASSSGSSSAPADVTADVTAAQEQSIVGSWSTELYGDEYVYTFNENGTGTYTAAGKEMQLTYEVKNGIYYETFEGSVKANERPYRVVGNQFIVEDAFGDEIVYERK